MKTIIQLANFERLISLCNAYGTLYAPGIASLQMSGLNSLFESARQSITNMNEIQIAYDITVHTRSEAFAELPKLMTRVVNTLATEEVSQASVELASAIVKRFYPRRKPRRAAPSSEQSTPTENPEAVSEQLRTRRITQLDYPSKAHHFNDLIQVISTEPGYNPGMVELQLSSLSKHLDHLCNLNKTVLDLKTTLNRARIIRDRLVYSRTGIHGIALAVKR